MSGDSPRGIPPNSTALTSTSTHQDAVPPGRPDSPVMIIDPETIAFVRLYTTVGDEVIYGNLIFSRDHDPFANVAIPQDVAETVASRFNDAEIEENPRESDAISVEPLSVRPPSSCTTESPHVRLTPPTSQSAGSSQAGESADKPGDIPTIIQDSLLVAFSHEDLSNFRRYFYIPSFRRGSGFRTAS
ncbi:hypothetical protein LIER_06320 [Lithospermum erythrorhizon]|uniref:Uncharacterized protein n=1 Tax=Lithospermum erythrorhizon TaxID=34254 RepID=A0AAV3P539_LITER